MKEILILDYGLGNLFSVQQACREVGMNVSISSNPQNLDKADGIILPGVGAFGKAMEELTHRKLIEPLKEFSRHKPLLGVCLGMQLLLDSSEEFGHYSGLGLVKGKVKKIPGSLNGLQMRIPQMGWNSLNFSKSDHPALHNIPEGSDMYFVHSYYVHLEDAENELTSTNYEGFSYTSSLVNDNIWAYQFHPEKSGKTGLEIYRNWGKYFSLLEK